MKYRQSNASIHGNFTDESDLALSCNLLSPHLDGIVVEIMGAFELRQNIVQPLEASCIKHEAAASAIRIATATVNLVATATASPCR